MDNKQTLIQYIQDPQHFAEAIANIPRRIPGTEDYEPRRGISHIGLYREMLSNRNVKSYFAEHMPDFPPYVFEQLLHFFGIKENDIHVFFDNESPRFFAMQQPIIPFKPFNSVENASGTFGWERNEHLHRDEFKIAGIHKKRMCAVQYIRTDEMDAYQLNKLDFSLKSDELQLPTLTQKPYKHAYPAGLMTQRMSEVAGVATVYSLNSDTVGPIFRNCNNHPGVAQFLSAVPGNIPVYVSP